MQKETLKTTYSLADGQQGEKILMINGVQSVCPFVPAIPIKGQVGQIQIMRMPCSTLCPLADIQEHFDGSCYYTNCGNTILTYKIEEQQQPDGGSPILKAI